MITIHFGNFNNVLHKHSKLPIIKEVLKTGRYTGSVDNTVYKQHIFSSAEFNKISKLVYKKLGVLF